MEIFLFVMFIDDRGPYVSDGWFPMEQSSMEMCETRKESIEDYLFEVSNTPYKVICDTRRNLSRAFPEVFDAEA